MPISVVVSGSGGGSSASWSTLTGKPSTFPPSAHNQAASTITGLATVATSGSYNDLSNKPTLVTSVNGQSGSVTVPGGTPPTVVALSYSSTLATDASAGSVFDVTLTGNVTLSNPTNGSNGQTLRWRILQDSTGGRTVTLGNKFALPASVSSLEFSTAANKMDTLAATYHAGRDKWDVVALVVGY